MQSLTAPFMVVLSFLVLGSSAALADGIIAPGAKLETLSTDFKFSEGPASDAEGNVYFTDQPNDRIMKWTVDGKFETFLQPSGRCTPSRLPKREPCRPPPRSC